MNQSKIEERWNALSHATGIVLAVVGLFLLLNRNTHKTSYSIWSIVVYSLSLIVLYTASTLYHIASKKTLKKKLRIFDHASIYLLIAGSYTPVCLITLEKENGWLIFTVVWIIALLGVLLKLFFTGKYEVLSLILYVLMGWLIVFDISNLLTQMPGEGLFLLALGGFLYTIGIIFYAVKKIPFNHVIWHFFVLGGSISHWLAMYFYVI